MSTPNMTNSTTTNNEFTKTATRSFRALVCMDKVVKTEKARFPQWVVSKLLNMSITQAALLQKDNQGQLNKIYTSVKGLMASEYFDRVLAQNGLMTYFQNGGLVQVEFGSGEVYERGGKLYTRWVAYRIHTEDRIISLIPPKQEAAPSDVDPNATQDSIDPNNISELVDVSEPNFN